MRIWKWLTRAMTLPKVIIRGVVSDGGPEAFQFTAAAREGPSSARTTVFRTWMYNSSNERTSNEILRVLLMPVCVVLVSLSQS